MPDLLNAGEAWLAGALKAGASQQVTYRRGSQSITLQATIGTFDVANATPIGNVTLERVGLDFIVQIADLTFGEPLLNDLIDFDGSRYVVSRPDGSREVFYDDVAGLTYRIHAKYKEAV